ncbi:MAG TPA: hypothetical protein VFV78_01525 [Vicinamibacterales bacterium]|nr:hypothetical protein [Vicinamibacterales bacterium]
MSDTSESPQSIDLGEYCRRVEEHLTRVNAGHLVRIVGTGFAMVKGWAEAGIPLSLVFRGIDMKAERHREGASARALRIEFCDPDVQSVFRNWRRAVGFTTGTAAGASGGLAEEEADGEPASKRPSVTKHLDRAIDRLSRAGGRLEWPDALRDTCDRVLQQLVAIRDQARKARGAARDELVARLPALDAELAASLRADAPESLRRSVREEAMADLASYRSRLSAEAWERSIDVTADRLMRDRLGLPVIEL